MAEEHIASVACWGQLPRDCGVLSTMRSSAARVAGLASMMSALPSDLPREIAAGLTARKPGLGELLERLPPTRRAAANSAGITPEQRLIQRTTMGFSQYELELIGELGYQGYLEHQLHPEDLDDSDLEREALGPLMGHTPVIGKVYRGESV